MKRLVVLIPDSLHHRARVLAAERRVTMAELVREVLDREIARSRELDPLTRHLPSPTAREIAARRKDDAA